MNTPAKANTLSGAEAMVRMLEAYGVKHIFGLCGDTTLPLYDALYRLDHAITHLLTRDERHAGALQIAGADAVIPETLESALQLGALALQSAGMPEGELRAVLASERAVRIASYRNQSSNGSPT